MSAKTDFVALYLAELPATYSQALPVRSAVKLLAEAIYDANGSLTPAAKSVNNTKLANMVTQTIKGRITAGTEAPEDLTVEQVKTMIGLGENATTGVHGFNIGTLASPEILETNPGATVMPVVINVEHSAGAGDCEDLIAVYDRVKVLGVGDSGTNAIALATRAYQGSDASNANAAQVYGIQTFAKKAGTGTSLAVSAISAKLMTTNGAVQATNSINAGHFHISGGTEEGYTPASGVTCPNFDGVMIEVYPDVVDLDSGLKIAVDSGAAVTSAIELSGAAACEVKLSSGAKIFTGSAANENAVYAAVGTKDAVGSLYISTAGGLYIQVANNGADADWQKVTSTHT